MRISCLVGGLLVSACGLACGQVISHVEQMATLPVVKAEPEWKGLLKVERECTWDVCFHARAFMVPGKDGKPDKRADPAVGGVFCMPWVERSATQVSDAASVEMGLSLNGGDAGGVSVWLDSPRGMERLAGLEVKAPPGQVMAFEKSASGPDNGLPLMVMDMEILFRATARRVKVDQAMLERAIWPAAWPAEAAGAMSKQVFRETGVDPADRLVRDVDDAALAEMVADILRARGIKDVRKVTPAKVMREVVAEVSRRLRMGGNGIVASADATNAAMGKGATEVPLYELQGAFEGIEVRDALTVLRSTEPANAAERAVALAAVYRGAGLPCRVCIGFEAGQSTEKKLVKKIKDDARAERDAKKPLKPLRPSVMDCVLPPPRPRYWVEVAVTNGEELAWVPVDPGKGGDSWKIGSIEDSEKVVVLGTNYWPAPVRVVGALGTDITKTTIVSGYNSTVTYEVRRMPDGMFRARLVEKDHLCNPMCSLQKAKRRTFDLAAGLWGYWLEDHDSPTVFQQLGVVMERVAETRDGPVERR